MGGIRLPGSENVLKFRVINDVPRAVALSDPLNNTSTVWTKWSVLDQ